jgi:CubicO group peptidase (beta-lactamase class C family)
MDLMYDFLSGYHLTRAPGSTYQYSSYGFGLLGNLLVRRAGVADYEALLLERITRPLGMDSTRIEMTPDLRSRLAFPHSSYSVVTSNWDAPTIAGSGGIRSTANDMLTFLAANMGMTDTELSPALQLANTPQRPTNSPEYIGLGWVLPKSGNGTHWHGGAHPGYTSFLAWDSDRKIGVILLMNVYNGPNIGYTLMGGLPKPFPVDPLVLAEYAGTYQVSEDIFVTIRVDGTRIFAQATGLSEFEFFARSENQFYPRDIYAECTFYRNASGEVDRLVYVENGITTEAKKVP